MNEFLGRSPYTPFAKEEADATYIAWRNSIAERDNARFTEAMQTAPKGSWVVSDNWQVGSSTIRRGQVVYC